MPLVSRFPIRLLLQGRGGGPVRPGRVGFQMGRGRGGAGPPIGIGGIGGGGGGIGGGGVPGSSPGADDAFESFFDRHRGAPGGGGASAHHHQPRGAHHMAAGGLDAAPSHPPSAPLDISTFQTHPSVRFGYNRETLLRIRDGLLARGELRLPTNIAADHGLPLVANEQQQFPDTSAVRGFLFSREDGVKTA